MKLVNRLVVGVIAVLLGTGCAFAQETLSGKYEGTAKSVRLCQISKSHLS